MSSKDRNIERTRRKIQEQRGPEVIFVDFDENEHNVTNDVLFGKLTELADRLNGDRVRVRDGKGIELNLFLSIQILGTNMQGQSENEIVDTVVDTMNELFNNNKFTVSNLTIDSGTNEVAFFWEAK